MLTLFFSSAVEGPSPPKEKRRKLDDHRNREGNLEVIHYFSALEKYWGFVCVLQEKGIKSR